MAKFRKKPVVIEAMQWHGYNWSDVSKWAKGSVECVSAEGERGFGTLYVKTLEGTMAANYGDWIIKGVNGEFYPCKPDIFDKTYERVDE